MLSLSTTWRSAFARVLPTSLFLMMVGLVPVMLSGLPIHPRAPLIALSQVVANAVGFGLVLTLIRRRLADDAPVLGRPAIVVGVVAPIVNMLSLMVAFSPDKSRLRDLIVCAAGGAIFGLTMFFPWMTRGAGVPRRAVDPEERPKVRGHASITGSRAMAECHVDAITDVAHSRRD
jgi:hypothetical protein